ncbi:MAG TPA: MDR family MFS transporter [Actinomycetales bacterium]
MLIALMLSTALVALDATILATAVPSVVQDLGGFSQFPWLFSVYLLAQAVSVPLYGKLADMVGRKPVILLGIALFVVGSVLCGAAWSLPSLIAFRVVQGLGAGAVQPIALTMIGDMYSVEERSRVQGYLASVWGIASVVGPTLGGVFSEYVSWRWIFFVNVPVGALAAWMIWRRFEEKVQRREHTVDYTGAVLLTIGCSLVILAMLEGGQAWDWVSAPGIAVPAVGVALLVLFLRVEQRAAEPVLPLWVLRRRVLVGGNLVGLGVGALLIGLSSYVPTYVQGVLGTGPLVAGFALAALTLGWPISAALSGRVYLRIGFRDTALIGAAVVVVGTVAALWLGAESSVAEVAAACFVIGIGMGLTASPTLVAIQSVVGWRDRGVVTATNLFSRSIGSAVGVAVFGAIANATLADRLAQAPASLREALPEGPDAAASVLGSGAGLPPAALALVRSALSDATHLVFIALAVTAVATAAALLLMPRRTVPIPGHQDD